MKIKSEKNNINPLIRRMLILSIFRDMIPSEIDSNRLPTNRRDSRSKYLKIHQISNSKKLTHKASVNTGIP